MTPGILRAISNRIRQVRKPTLRFLNFLSPSEIAFRSIVSTEDSRLRANLIRSLGDSSFSLGRTSAFLLRTLVGSKHDSESGPQHFPTYNDSVAALDALSRIAERKLKTAERETIFRSLVDESLTPPKASLRPQDRNVRLNVIRLIGALATQGRYPLESAKNYLISLAQDTSANSDERRLAINELEITDPKAQRIDSRLRRAAVA